jgi:chromosome segregation ATPase
LRKKTLGDEINMDLFEKSESRKIESPVVIETSDKSEEITQFRKHVETIEPELEQANEKIQRLRNNKLSSISSKAVASQTTTYHVKNLKNISESETLNANIESLRKENDLANERIQNILSETKLSENALKQLNQNQEEQIDSLKLEVKQLQQIINQEKMIQIQEHKQKTLQLDDLKAETGSLKSSLNDKLNKIKLLKDEITDLNMNIACLKSNDLSLTNQLKISNQKISQLDTEKEQLIEQKKQFEFMLEEKNRESSQLKNDVQKHLQHIGAQSKALEKLQAELKLMLAKHENDEETEEVAFLKQQYNQIYSCLEHKNQESLSYYNEIQRLNLVVSDLNKEILNAKNFNENLTEQYENLVKEFQVEQKIVEELNLHIVDLSEQTSSLAKDSFQFKKEINDQEQERIENYSNESSPQLTDRDNLKKEIKDNLLKEDQKKLFDVEGKNRQIFEQMQFQIDQLTQEKDKLERNQEFIINQCNFKLSELHSKFIEDQKAMVDQMQIQLSQERENFLSKENDKTKELNNKYNETVAQYENKLKALTESYSNETQRNDQIIKELNRLKEHLVEISESFNKEAIQAEEREKNLRLKLTEAEKSLEQFDANIETSRCVFKETIFKKFILTDLFKKAKN